MQFQDLNFYLNLGINERAFNGEQLRKKLLKLLEEQPQRKASIEKKRVNSGRSINGMTASHPLKRIERNKSLTFNGKSSMNLEHSKVDDRNSTIDRQLTLDSRNKRSRKPSEKSKSDFDLTSLPMDQPLFENLRLPPPQEFRDFAPLPPDQFRDPPSLEDTGDVVEIEKVRKSENDEEDEDEEEEEEEISEKPLPAVNKSQQKPSVTPSLQSHTHTNHQPVSQQNSNQIIGTPVMATSTLVHPQAAIRTKPPQQIIEAIDNPLYHVYEIKRLSGPPRQFCKSQSNNELLTMVRAASVNDKLISHHNHLKNQLSNPNSPAQTSDRSDSIINGGGEERVKNGPPMQLMEFEKCREEFRKQINYSGSIYSDFKAFASEMPYFNISDEYRTFSPAGVHLIVCVHGLDGNSADLRLVRTYMELGMPGVHLEFL